MATYPLQDIMIQYLPAMSPYVFPSDLRNALTRMYAYMEYEHVVPAEFQYVSPIVSTVVTSGSSGGKGYSNRYHSGGGGVGSGGGGDGGDGWTTVGSGGRRNGRGYNHHYSHAGGMENGGGSSMAYTASAATAPTPVQLAKQQQGNLTTPLKLLLNKLSPKTEATIERKLMEEMDKYVSDAEYHREVYPVLFTFLSSNLFYVQLYTKMYVSLCRKYEWFRALHMETITAQSLIAKWYRMEGAGASGSDAGVGRSGASTSAYDVLCDQNKKSDEKKAFTAFLCHLYAYTRDSEGDGEEKVWSSWYSEWVAHLVASVEFKKSGTAVSETEEIVDWMYLVFTTVAVDAEPYRAALREQGVVEKVTEWSKWTPKMWSGWSNKATFKCLDILDAVRKW